MPGAKTASPIPPAPPAPALARDPWALAAVLAVVPLLLRCLGAPLGEPVAEDFDFLRRALLSANHSLLDGGGSLSFWRPVSHQLYYLAFGRLMLLHPGTLAAIHALLLATGTLLVYRALRPAWSGPAAAAAVAYPLLAESVRTLVAWPSHFVDLGLYFFTALALHETSRRRLPTALAALLAALGCKEVALVAGLLLPLWPGLARRDRLRWAAGCGVVLLGWGLAYLAVRNAAGLVLPHQIESDPALRATSLAARLGWAFWNSARSLASLPLAATPRDPLAFAIAALVAGAAIAAVVTRPDARRRFAGRAGWVAWGGTWFALATATLAAIYPLWQPNRHHFGAVGLGIAAAAVLEAAGPWFLAAMIAARVTLLSLAPAPPATITRQAPATGAFMDFERLTRLQRLMRGMREALHARWPELPPGARLVQHNLPFSAEYALGGSNALQVWYADTTLRWMRFAEYAEEGAPAPIGVVEFEPFATPQVTVVEPAAMSALVAAQRLLAERRYADVLPALARAESAQGDARARAFLGAVRGTRATALAALGERTAAEREAREAIALYPLNTDGRFLLGVLAIAAGRNREAIGHLDTLLLESPGDSLATALRERARAAR